MMNERRRGPSVTDTQINVTSKDGIVSLRGSVPHYFDKSSADESIYRGRRSSSCEDRGCWLSSM